MHYGIQSIHTLHTPFFNHHSHPMPARAQILHGASMTSQSYSFHTIKPVFLVFSLYRLLKLYLYLQTYSSYIPSVYYSAFLCVNIGPRGLVEYTHGLLNRCITSKRERNRQNLNKNHSFWRVLLCQDEMTGRMSNLFLYSKTFFLLI